MSFTPDGKTLLAGDVTGALTFWDVQSGRVCETVEEVHPPGIRMLRLSHDGSRMLLLGFDNAGHNHFLPVWDVSARRRLFPEMWHHESAVTALAVSPDGKWLATAGEDKQAWIWDLVTAQVVRQLPRQGGRINLLSFPSSQSLYTGGFGGLTPRLWDVGTGRSLQVLEYAAVAAAFSPDGKLFANAWPTEIHVFDRKTGRQMVRHPLPHNITVRSRSLAFTPDGRLLLWADGQGLGALDTKSGKVVKRIDQAGSIDSLTLAPDGKQLATTGGGFSFALWDRQRGMHPRALQKRNKIATRVDRLPELLAQIGA